ncbi:MAG: hypothetical protein MHM6MM_003562 [Cercozoa sp. M6MM]
MCAGYDMRDAPEQAMYKCGYLIKVGGGTSRMGRKSHKRRWFVLRGRSLVYYKSRESRTPIKNLEVDLSARAVTVIDEDTFCFRISGKAIGGEQVARDFVLFASDRADLEDWLRALRTSSTKQFREL